MRRSASSAGSTISPPRTTSGSTARKTQRQPSVCVSHADTGGPTNEGMTHAVEMKVNMRGRCRGAKARAMITNIAVLISPLPRPWTSRPATSWAMCGALAARSRPAAKMTSPASIGATGPLRSLARPATTVATSIPTMNSENDQA